MRAAMLAPLLWVYIWNELAREEILTLRFVAPMSGVKAVKLDRMRQHNAFAKGTRPDSEGGVHCYRCA